MSIEYADRTRRILEGVLGAEPTIDQYESASQAFWVQDPYQLKTKLFPEVPEDPSNDDLTKLHTETVKQFHRGLINAAADTIAFRDFEQDIIDRSEELKKPFEDEEVEQRCD